MGKKKQYVLWVVHTDPDPTTTESQDFTKTHIEHVIRAMKAAQDAGIPVVYENKGSEYKEQFLRLARREGVKKIIETEFFDDLEGGKAVAAFLKTMKELGLSKFEVLFAGHYVSTCINERAKELKEKRIAVNLVGGLACLLGRGTNLKEVEKFYGKNGIIPIDKIRDLW